MKNVVRLLKMSILTFVLIVFVSCQSKSRIFSENQELSPQMEWLKKDAKTFKVQIKDTSIHYKLSLAFRYIEGFSYEVLNVKVTEISPSKKETSKIYDLKVVSENGEYIGQPGLEIWDSEHLIEASKKFSEKGMYTYRIEHVMSVDNLNMAMEIGVILDKK